MALVGIFPSVLGNFVPSSCRAAAPSTIAEGVLCGLQPGGGGERRTPPTRSSADCPSRCQSRHPPIVASCEMHEAVVITHARWLCWWQV